MPAPRRWCRPYHRSRLVLTVHRPAAAHLPRYVLKNLQLKHSMHTALHKLKWRRQKLVVLSWRRRGRNTKQKLKQSVPGTADLVVVLVFIVAARKLWTNAANIQVSEESSRPMSHAGNGNAEQSPSELVTQTSSISTTTSCRPLLKVVAVTVSGPAGSVDTFALLDDGSTATFIDSEITSQIGVTGTVEQIELQCVGGLSKQSQVEYVDFQIKGKRSADSFVIKQARSINNLGLANRNVNKSDVLAFSYLLDIADELCYNAKPTIIIGIDNWNLSVPMAVRQGTSSQPVAILTVLGWVLFGFVQNRTNTVHFVNNVCDYDLCSDNLRVVNNAVAKLGVSSNKLPLREPDLLKSFLNIVNRFYEESVIINDDIKAIYPQVKIHNVYCDAQRFTWRDSSKEPLKTYLMSSMIYGAASSPFTDLLINNKSRYQFPRVTHVIFHDHYIDNYITSRYRVC
ncbi:uncharacterized protein LOC131854905 [Achroia grisella]|uniref:uncharacterized protein LOC131854905 n=1 Tax=Achroia grisella TaxID=688607 RepID=UPI0027D1F9B0|nr:uncharacterized protein LOC131854905 [Achroia grisella]